MREVSVPVVDGGLVGDVSVPDGAGGVVLFAHGSGSSRHSPRNMAVGRALNERGLATVLVDLLTADEEARDEVTAELRFDIGMLAERLAGIVDWMGADPELGRLPIGLFGASTGAAAALVAAAARPDRVGAVVSRGGRPDLAGSSLTAVRAPTLLLVGGLDEQVIVLNEQARDALGEVAELRIVPGATHLFEEPGTLEQVADQAGTWFTTHLRQPHPA
ncbi:MULTISPECIES: dienelactone hydrolase family protein [unclassified Micromonospora]|uniref:dienelactone hydrolase family protein n=1 Tax=unclassified Micromonospora TaxID=2617518 RepID=UPI001B38F548|nr:MULTISPECIES: alpha/beta fold hydrolase [unclassified Micromonospora]MBQ1044250.1 dienelactone hydrolase family protein [Micromonospora sp. C72]MBQ1058402.1 dienelactone hydrolase family protein [Micromonospora sp. C32]